MPFRKISARIVFACALIGAATAVFAGAQDDSWAARPLAFGGAYTAILGGSYAQMWNPAANGEMRGREVAFSPQAPAFRTNGWNRTTLSFVETSTGTPGGYGFWWAQDVKRGSFRENRFAVNFARPILDTPRFGILSAGANLKYYNNTWSAPAAGDRSAVGGDLGLVYLPTSRFIVGAALRDLNSPRIGVGRDDKIPAKLSAGGSIWLTSGYIFSADALETFDAEKSHFELRGGAEKYFSRNTYALRAGANAHYLTAGFGFRFGGSSTLDYGFAYPFKLEKREREHVLTVSYRFGLKESVVGLPGIPASPWDEEIEVELPAAKPALPPAPPELKKRQAIVLGPKDVLKIEVKDHPELDVTVTADPWGFIKLPFIGEMTVKGLTAQDVAKTLEEIYAGFFSEGPKVDVSVVEFNSGVVYVMGAVRNPGKYNLQGSPLTVRDVVVLAGLPTERAAAWRVFVIHQGPKGPVYRHVNLERILNRGHLENDIELSSGDIVYVPQGFLDVISSTIGRVLSPIFGVSSSLAARGI